MGSELTHRTCDAELVRWTQDYSIGLWYLDSSLFAQNDMLVGAVVTRVPDAQNDKPYHQVDITMSTFRDHNYFVYITTNPNKKVLYTGVTNNLEQRITEHYLNRGIKKTFAGRYYCYCLLYYERHSYINHAIEREKEIKKWKRWKKIELIDLFNPKWKCLNVTIMDWPPGNDAMSRGSQHS